MSETTTVDPGTWIRGITIRQPWTSCILAGKDVENRPVPWSWRGWLLLHAGQVTERAPMRDALVATAIRGRALHTRAVIGVARLTDCHQDAAGTAPCSKWAQADAFHLVLADVQELALPIPWLHGQLGPWRPPQDLVDQVLLQLPHLAPEATS
ncbi:hypothetical protein [Streptomyces drozdowiczii]|uniref:ASCH domain-containing protein n=1 Tax=Streptomyces drozdowiczii TaxID=202862 RepID=A0ABY6Q295_9ACTN|nr:hypothetical protein [Streptomyces drozdowiczii]MCX0241857.1 hypothetical protein [Streptomyces drozdowiczii]UZK58298.1 hypothetical protein NEH16_33245 [Streptomyces drozdowiczii]